MEFKQFDDVHEFAVKAEPILAKGEDVYSLFLECYRPLKQGDMISPFMGTIEENGEVLALFQMTPPHPLNLIFVDENRLEASIDLLVTNLVNLAIDIPSIISLKPWAYQFSAKWSTVKGTGHQLLMDQGLYRLNKVEEYLEKSPGTWRLAEEKDCPLIEKWFNRFEGDTGLPMTDLKDVKKRVAFFVGEREVFLWENQGKVVSMMKKSRPTQRGVTVSLVFTPQEERRKGYARTMVAACSKELLKEYEFCVLYTDMMNPTSNKIYQEIGYEKIVDSVHLGFENT